jgi:hypothetical protein
MFAMIYRVIAGATLALSAALPVQAAVGVTSPAFTYSQSFDSLASTGTANVWANDSTLPGWAIYTTAGAEVTLYRAGTGSTTNGAAYSFGTGADRALGGVGSGSFSGYFALALSNLTGTGLSSFTLAFDGEQWRNGGNATAQTMAFQYGFGSSYASVATWTAPGANFDWTSPINTTTAAAVDGNAAGLVANRGGTITTPWAAGQTLWLRWADENNAGNDHGLAIDNVALSVSTGVPEPETFALMLAGLGALGLLARRRR